MNDVYKALNYYKFRKSIITLFLLGLVVPTIHLLTTQNTTSLNVKYIFLPILFSFVAILVITVSRKLLLGKLLAYDLDFKTIYMLEKRKDTKKNEYHNLKLLTNVYFFSGDFQEALSSAIIILKSQKANDVFYARHLQIMTLFIMGEYKEIPNLIILQKDMLSRIKKEIVDDVSDYYSFINTYIAGNYQDSVGTLKNLLSKKDYDKLNHKKIVIFYFLLMVYEKLNDTENMLICTNEIICSDPNNYTFFRHTVEGD